ncbi:hypothetical protein L9F63_005144 [Diploptera punctata]|uniref:Uncharacterized protein n=1 Tax=Diploptera punctata TaxID=6984 RepID=A0AAD8E6K9_DIPPU|nr:hypothetical protein L9F63_005144 [Diploptera punctata]
MAALKRRRSLSGLRKEGENNNHVNTSWKTERKTKSLHQSMPKPTKWKSNNIQLAKENAQLRKDIEKCITALNESTVRCENLEMAWRRRGETLTKIDIMSRLVGSHISNLLETLTELRSACQVELAIPLERVIEPLNQLSYLSHSIPSKTKKFQQVSNRSQLVNPVNPMISGHAIIKPTITLQRLSLRNVPSNVSERQIQPELQLLSEVEIPLERLSMSQIAERIGINSNNIPQLEEQENNVFSSEEIPSHISMNTILEENMETCSQRNSITSEESPISSISLTNSDWPAIPLDESSVSNLYSNSMRKYPRSACCVRTTSSIEQRNPVNADKEKCLVVALKDVGSYLRNGTLTNIELLEERKVKTGASAHPEVKIESNIIIDPDVNVESSNTNDDIELGIPSASEDQTEVNIMGGIETINYGAISVQNKNENSISSIEDFFNRIQEEDPLEGPSWRFDNITKRETKKRYRSMHTSSSGKKNKQNDELSSIKIPEKSRSMELSKFHEPIDEDLQLESEAPDNTFIDTEEKDIEETSLPSEKTKLKSSVTIEITEEEDTKLHISDFSNEFGDSSQSSPEISSCENKEVNFSFGEFEHVSELEADCTPNKRSRQNISPTDLNKTRIVRKKKGLSKRNRSLLNSNSKVENYKKSSVKLNSKTKTSDYQVSEIKREISDTRRDENIREQCPRARRMAAPKCLKEPSLGVKLRRA